MEERRVQPRPRQSKAVIKVSKTREFAASIDRIWNMISNLRNEKRYWPLIKDSKILKRTANTIEREATILRGPLGDVKSVQTLSMVPKKSITLRMIQGPLIGTRKIIIGSLGSNRTRVEIIWEFELQGIPRFAESFVKDRISRVTEDALSQMAKETEQP